MYSDQLKCFFLLRCDAMRLHLFSFAILSLFCFFIRRNRTPFGFCFFFRKLLPISQTEFIDSISQNIFRFLWIQLAFGSLHLWLYCQSFSVPNEKKILLWLMDNLHVGYAAACHLSVCDCIGLTIKVTIYRGFLHDNKLDSILSVCTRHCMQCMHTNCLHIIANELF